MVSQFFKYLTKSKDDELWGLYLNVAGKAVLGKGDLYPPQGHPGDYSFFWQKGRILNECQLLYITDGEGYFETRENKYSIKSGTLIVLHPGMWHRYKPNINTGWTEYYIGFNGEFLETLLDNRFFNPENPVYQIGFDDSILQLYKDVIKIVEAEKQGFQSVAAGIVIQILARLRQHTLKAGLKNKPLEKIINKARIIMRENLDGNLNMEDVALKLNTGYSLFRKEFKKYTGMSPGQYHLQLRIREAQNLISNSDKTIKEIAYLTGFESPYYFSRIYKKVTGEAPSKMRGIKGE